MHGVSLAFTESWIQTSRTKLGECFVCFVPNHICHGVAWATLTKSSKLKKREGGGLDQNVQMQAFRDTLDFCGFLDLGYMGPEFTW